MQQELALQPSSTPPNPSYKQHLARMLAWCCYSAPYTWQRYSRGENECSRRADESFGSPSCVHMSQMLHADAICNTVIWALFHIHCACCMFGCVETVIEVCLHAAGGASELHAWLDRFVPTAALHELRGFMTWYFGPLP